MRPALFAAIVAIVFIAGDAVMIPFVMRPMFKAALGDAMLDTLRLGPAAGFYLVHIGVLTIFGMRARSIRQAALDGGLIGLAAYSCYEMTSWTIMRDWAAHLAVIDIAWGVAISGLATLSAAVLAGPKAAEAKPSPAGPIPR
jgi:uncharacterized membrane protein